MKVQSLCVLYMAIALILFITMMPIWMCWLPWFTYQTTGKRIAPQHIRSTRMKICCHIAYSDWPSSLSSMMIYAMLSRIYNRMMIYAMLSRIYNRMMIYAMLSRIYNRMMIYAMLSRIYNRMMIYVIKTIYLLMLVMMFIFKSQYIIVCFSLWHIYVIQYVLYNMRTLRHSPEFYMLYFVYPWATWLQWSINNYV